jgi:hypothetical protein
MAAFSVELRLRKTVLLCDVSHRASGLGRCQAFQLTGDASNTDPDGMKHWLQSRKRIQIPTGDRSIASLQPPESTLT